MTRLPIVVAAFVGFSTSMVFVTLSNNPTMACPEMQNQVFPAVVNTPDFDGYKPAPAESFVLNHTGDLGLDAPMPDWVTSCHVLTDPKATPHHARLQKYIEELKNYYKLISATQLPVKDLRRSMTKNDNSVCELVKLHPEGLPGIFAESQQLSLSSSGWVEPLLPPMRHPEFCQSGSHHNLMRTDYLVHDFYALCQNLKPHSRTVFLDMGASLSFHGNTQSPVLGLIQLYQRFGFKFDHVYGYEYRPHDPQQVFKDIPEYLEAAYHWINVGVTSDQSSRQNPFKMLLENYEPDDLIIVKLDVDTPELERELAQQLVDDPRLGKLIDHFYFEHHVNQKELQKNWGKASNNRITESVGDSLRLFHKMRQAGIPAHFWV